MICIVIFVMKRLITGCCSYQMMNVSYTFCCLCFSLLVYITGIYYILFIHHHTFEFAYRLLCIQPPGLNLGQMLPTLKLKNTSFCLLLRRHLNGIYCSFSAYFSEYSFLCIEFPAFLTQETDS